MEILPSFTHPHCTICMTFFLLHKNIIWYNESQWGPTLDYCLKHLLCSAEEKSFRRHKVGRIIEPFKTRGSHTFVTFHREVFSIKKMKIYNCLYAICLSRLCFPTVDNQRKSMWTPHYIIPPLNAQYGLYKHTSLPPKAAHCTPGLDNNLSVFFPLKAFVFRAVEGCYYPAWCERGRKLCKLSHYSRSWEWPAFNGSLHGRTASRTRR